MEAMNHAQLLDGSIEHIEQELAKGELPLEVLQALREAEEAGKTRKGAIEAIDAAITALQPDPGNDQDGDGSTAAAADEGIATGTLAETILSFASPLDLAFGGDAKRPIGQLHRQRLDTGDLQPAMNNRVKVDRLVSVDTRGLKAPVSITHVLLMAEDAVIDAMELAAPLMLDAGEEGEFNRGSIVFG